MSRCGVCWKCGKNKPYSNANLCKECHDKFFFNRTTKKDKYKEKVGGNHGGSLARLYSERKRHNRKNIPPKTFTDNDFAVAYERIIKFNKIDDFSEGDWGIIESAGRKNCYRKKKE